MNDTPPAVREMVRQMLMERAPQERFLMGVLMFDAARQMVLASLPKDLPAPELRRQLFHRIYGQAAPFLKETRAPTEPPRGLGVRAALCRFPITNESGWSGGVSSA